MKLSKFTIKNFRGITEMTMDIYNYASLIGPNNCGKSSILQALIIFLNQEKPQEDDWNKESPEKEMILEGMFTDIQDWERKISGVAGIIQNEAIRLRVKFEPHVSKGIYEACVEREEIDNWSNKIGDLKKTWINAVLEELGITTAAELKLVSNQERIKQNIRDKYPDKIHKINADWTSESISIDAALKQALPHAEIIPAVKDATEDTKPQAKTTFGRLLNAIIIPAIQNTPEFEKLKNSVEALSKIVRGANGTKQPEIIERFSTDISSRIAEIINVKAILDIAEPDTEKFLGSNAILRLNDGIETDISHQGNGAQRSLVFALIEAVAKFTSKGSGDTENMKSTILLFEEPELYLHPHLMRRLKSSLIEISKKQGWQVVISTHSPILIDVVENPKSLLILKKSANSREIVVTQLTADPFDDESKEALRATLNFHPTVNECFFADRVVLVEGDTEISILTHEDKPYQKFGIDDKTYSGTTVISCGGKWTIPAIAILMGKFNIPYRVMHDRDAKGRTQEALDKIDGALDPYKANTKIREIVGEEKLKVIDDTFEDIIWPRVDKSRKISNKDKPYRSWTRIKEICKDGSITQYKDLKEVFEFVFKW